MIHILTKEQHLGFNKVFLIKSCHFYVTELEIWTGLGHFGSLEFQVHMYYFQQLCLCQGRRKI